MALSKKEKRKHKKRRLESLLFMPLDGDAAYIDARRMM